LRFFSAIKRLSEAFMSDSHDSHTGPIKSPSQLLWTSLFFLVAPVFIIIGLVYFVTSGDKPAAGAVDQEIATAKRIQRVGLVELQDGNRALQAGGDVYRAQCAACHDAGLVGAPKFGAAADWSARMGQGFDALVSSVINGKGSMGAQAGGAFNDIELARATAYLANSAGANFKEPADPNAE
jgi:cytochrome c5